MPRRVSNMSSSYGLTALTSDVSKLPKQRRDSHHQRMGLAVALQVGRTKYTQSHNFMVQHTRADRDLYLCCITVLAALCHLMA